MMKATLIFRAEHCAEEEYEEISISSFEEAVLACRRVGYTDCRCCAPAVRATLPSGEILKADPEGYWVANPFGQGAGDPNRPYVVVETKEMAE